MSKFIARVDPKLFAAAMLFQAKGDVRYYLNGVAIQQHPKKGVLIVATNGHVCFVAHDETGYVDSDRIVQIEDKTIGRSLAGTFSGYLYIAEKSCWLAEYEIGEEQEAIEPCPFKNPPKRYSKCNLVEGKFAEWKKVVPKQEAFAGSYAMPPINHEYLELIAKTVKLLSPKGHDAILSYPQSCEGGVVAFRASGTFADNVLMLVMPMRYDKHDHVIPPSIYDAKVLYDEEYEKAEAERKLEKQRKAKPRMRLTNGEWVAVEAEIA